MTEYIKNILIIKCIDFSDEGGFTSSNTCTSMCKLIINNNTYNLLI